MLRILFVCTGNICRSPMAEFLLRDMVEKAGLADRFEIASAGVSDEEYGAPVYPPVRRLLNARGISCDGKHARQLTRADYAKFDSIIAMTERHRRSMLRTFGGDPEGKLSLLLEYTDRPRDLDDPWYTGEFERAAAEIEEGLRGLVAQLTGKALPPTRKE